MQKGRRWGVLEQKILPIEGKRDVKGQKMRRFGAENSAHRG